MTLGKREDELVGVERLHGGPGSYGDDDADAIIVGGGPAGAITGLLLARSGRRVLIVERRAFPRDKPCGDCLSAAATGLLHRLGLLDRVLAADHARLAGWTLVGPRGASCQGTFNGTPALAIERKVLDDVLLTAARNEGVRVVHARATGLLRDQETGRIAGVLLGSGRGPRQHLRAPLVVGADGLRSVIARQLDAIRRPPRLRKVSLTTHGVGDLDGLRRGEMHVMDGGCIGIAPVGGGRFNLTLVVDHPRASRLREIGPDAFLHEWLDRAPVARERVADAQIDRPFLASGPFDWPTRTVTAPGAALVGDAAGYYDPFTGQGVHQAMNGARLLANALEGTHLHEDAALDRALRHYDRRLRRVKRPVRRVQRLVQVALARPGRADRVLRWLAASPVAMDRLLEVTGDLRPARALLSPRVLSSLILPHGPEVR